MRFDIEMEPHRKQKKEKKNNKLYFILLFTFLFVFLVLLITYVILSKDTPKRTVKPIKQIEEKKKSEIKIYDENSNDRPIAFMIDNNIGNAKHAGLQESYLNYEIIVEGGLTRIMAIYKDKNVKLIGPIRSSRHYFLDYALENDAIYAHFGWSPQAEKDIKELKVDNINGMIDSAPYRRDEKSIAPHNVFTNTTYIKDYLEKKDYSSTSTSWKNLNISPEEVNIGNNDNASTAKKIVIIYSDSDYRTYAYDDANKYYLRSQNGSPHLDRLTNEQLHYKNIIILKIENYNLDNEGRQTLKNIGNGEGYYITNGNYKKINWSKESRLSKTNLTYEDGSIVSLNDGNTFVQIVPINSNITIE